MSHSNGETNGQDAQTDFAKAWKELQEGEQQASIMERNLTALEKKIDDLLAAAESQEQEIKTRKAAEADEAARAVGEDKAAEKEEK